MALTEENQVEGRYEEELSDEKKEILRQQEFQQPRLAQRLGVKAAWKIHEVEIQTSAMFEEQNRGIINQATCELRMQENKAASTVDR